MTSDWKTMSWSTCMSQRVFHLRAERCVFSVESVTHPPGHSYRAAILWKIKPLGMRENRNVGGGDQSPIPVKILTITTLCWKFSWTVCSLNYIDSYWYFIEVFVEPLGNKGLDSVSCPWALQHVTRNQGKPVIEPPTLRSLADALPTGPLNHHTD